MAHHTPFTIPDHMRSEFAVALNNLMSVLPLGAKVLATVEEHFVEIAYKHFPAIFFTGAGAEEHYEIYIWSRNSGQIYKCQLYKDNFAVLHASPSPFKPAFLCKFDLADPEKFLLPGWRFNEEDLSNVEYDATMVNYFLTMWMD